MIKYTITKVYSTTGANINFNNDKEMFYSHIILQYRSDIFGKTLPQLLTELDETGRTIITLANITLYVYTRKEV